MSIFEPKYPVCTCLGTVHKEHGEPSVSDSESVAGANTATPITPDTQEMYAKTRGVRDTYWKTKEGEFIQLIEPSEREVALMLRFGCRLVPKAEDVFPGRYKAVSERSESWEERFDKDFSDGLWSDPDSLAANFTQKAKDFIAVELQRAREEGYKAGLTEVESMIKSICSNNNCFEHGGLLQGIGERLSQPTASENAERKEQ